MEKRIEVIKINKSYKNASKVLDNVTYSFETGKFYAIMGRSGAGKSTLLNLIGTIDRADSGEILVNGQDVTVMSEKEKSRLRIHDIGFIFQGFYLNPYLDAVENVVMPMRINPDIPAKERKEHALNLLDKFGVKELASSLPSQMSGGEQQRVCIARALANNPDIILADEPTGNLDEENEKIVFETLKALTQKGICVIVVSHNDEIKNYADEVIEMKKGKVCEWHKEERRKRQWQKRR